VPAINVVPLTQRTREINNDRLMEFELQLETETWESVYIDNATNNKFNSFLHTFLNIFEAGFPVKYNRNKNGWITQGIKLSCECKRKLHTHAHTAGDSNDAIIKTFYIKYCKILIKVI
jgi:hypothetical protein